MKKIPTLFKRDPEDMKRVLPEVNPECQWVLDGEGIATRKYDGTCVLIRRDGMAVNGYARREVKPGKTPPPGWVEVDRDEATGKRVGWEPIVASGFVKPFAEALRADVTWLPGTYELCGPKINGNPEGYSTHRLIRHADAEVIRYDLAEWNYDDLRSLLTDCSWVGEGIVWHHPDGRMAKLKARDFSQDAR